MQNGLRMPALVVAMILGASAGCDRTAQGKAETHGHAHDGGEHGHDQGHGEDLEPISVTLFTDQLQLFMEYPHLVTGESARFLAHLTVLQTGEPIRSGSLHFKVTDPQGNMQKVVVDAPKRDGLFIPGDLEPLNPDALKG